MSAAFPAAQDTATGPAPGGGAARHPTIGYGTHDWAMTAPGPAGYPSPGGACWARCCAPAFYLAWNGWTVRVGRPIWHDDGGLLVQTWDDPGHAHAVDVLVLQRCMRVEMIDRIRVARAAGQVVINDVDDWFWGLDPANQAFRHSHPKVSPDENRIHYAAILAASSAITCSTPYLADRLRRMLPGGPPVVVVRNGIDRARYTPKLTDEAGETPTVGWVGALPWRSGDLGVVEGALRTLCERGAIRFHHFGRVERAAHETAPTPVGDVGRIWRSAGDTMRISGSTSEPMCPIWEYPSRAFVNIDVGIAPLRDCPFNQSKSGIKALEYAAAGVPFVASGSPEYRRLADQGIGRIAVRHKDWVRELGRMRDPDWRAAERARNSAALAAHDLAERWQEWAAVYEDLYDVSVAAG